MGFCKRRGDREPVIPRTRAHHHAPATGITEALRPHDRQEVNSEPTGEDFLSISFLVDEEHREPFLAPDPAPAALLSLGRAQQRHSLECPRHSRPTEHAASLPGRAQCGHDARRA